MRIAVDARPLTAQPTGAGRVLEGLLPAWRRSFPGDRFVLLSPRSVVRPGPLDGDEAVEVRSGPRLPGTLWLQTHAAAAARRAGAGMQDLYAKKLIPSDTTNLLWPEVAQNFCDGNVAFYLEWYGWYSYFQDPESCIVAGKFGIVRGPIGAGDIHTGWAGAHAFTIPKASQNKEAAVQLIKFLSSQKVAYDEAKLGLLPVRDDVWKMIIADAETSDVALDKGRLEVPQTQISEDFFTPPLFADWISFTNVWYPTLQGIILGDASVEDGLATGVEDTKTLFTELGYTQ